ncbi:MAG TPA: carbohydrate ABC transporter permease [Spirochaetia bacterium]|nr:carbohydrate ABC transporter permease [Spirochaetia bacterium]
MRASFRVRRWLPRFGKGILAVVVLLIVLFPVAWLLLAAFKTTADVQRIPIAWLPPHPTLRPIIDVWLNPAGYSTDWIRFFLNTLIVAVATTAAVVVLGTIVGYGLARFKLRGSGFILFSLLVAQLFTGPALMIPTYVVITAIGLYNTLTGLVLAYIIFQTPFACWLSYSYFQNLPVELEEAASVDGCTPWRAFLLVTLPLTRIGAVTIGLMTFLLTWSEYPFAVALLENKHVLTVSVGLAQFITAFNIYWNQMAAASLFTAIPVLLLLVFAQRYFVKGLTAGALK